MVMCGQKWSCTVINGLWGYICNCATTANIRSIENLGNIGDTGKTGKIEKIGNKGGKGEILNVRNFF